MPLRPATTAAVRRAWRAGLEVGDDAWREAAVVPHGRRMSGWPGILAVELEDGVVVSAPRHLVPAALAVPVQSRMEPAAWVSAVGGRVVGPSRHLYLDAVDHLPDDPRVVPVPEGSALDRLRDAVSEAVWAEAGFAAPGEWFALREADVVRAAANLTDWWHWRADVGVLVHPRHRRRGLGTAVGAVAARHAIERFGVARWRAPEHNLASLAAARKLGFVPYGRNLAVLLDLLDAA